MPNNSVLTIPAVFSLCVLILGAVGRHDVALATADGPDVFKIVNAAAGESVPIRARPADDGREIAAVPAEADGLVNFGCVGGLDFEAWQKASAAEREDGAKSRWCRVGFEKSIGWVHGPLLGEGNGEARFEGGQRRNGLAGSAWKLRDFAGEIPEGEVSISFDETGRASGFGGCNRFHASFEEKPGVLSFGPVAATRMACPDPVGTIEQRFFQVLDRAETLVASKTLFAVFSPEDELLATFARVSEE